MTRTVLIVDDNAEIRRALQLALELNQVQVCGETVDGRDGIEKAAKLKPDLIVMDFLTPIA